MTDREQLHHDLLSFINAGTADAARRILEQHPVLLGKDADALLEQWERIEAAEHNRQAVRALQGFRELLRHCREVGISRGFAERLLSAESLAEAARRGVTPEAFLAQLLADEKIPIELHEVLAELATEGIKIRTWEDLELALVTRPDLRAKLDQGMPASSGGTAVPTEFGDHLRGAQEAEQRYLGTGDQAALDGSAAAWSRILEHTAFSSAPKGFRLGALNNAAVVFMRRYEARGRVDDLNRAVDLWEQVVAATPAGSPDLPMYLNNLGSGLRNRFARTGRESDLEEAIRVYGQAVEATPPDSPSRPGRLSNLGIGLSDRFARTGRETDLEESIRVYGQAVEATPPDSPNRPGHLSNLGSGLSARFARTGRETDLEESIWVFQQAVTATPPNSPDLPMHLSNLGSGLRNRFARTGRETDLEESIRVYGQAAEATPPDSPDLPGILNNLGNGLRDRFKRTGRETDLEESIRLLQQAVEATPPDSPNLLGRLNNLGNSFRDRFERRGHETDLEEAIRVYGQAIAATAPDSPDLPAMLNNLGNGLRDRFARTRRETDLEESIRVYGQAIAATAPDSPGLPGMLYNLGNVLSDRFACTEQEADLEEAIRVFRHSCELGVLSAPQAVLNTARNWGRWAFQRKQWGETIEAYGFGLAIGRQLLARQLHRAHKENWLRDLQEMSGPATYALAKLARYEEAATMMERGRARLLAEALQRNRRDLERLPARGHQELHRRYREIVERQEQLTQPAADAQPEQRDSLSGPARFEAIAAAHLAFDQVVADIQRIPGYADFLAEPTLAQIQAAQDTPVVYLVTTSGGGMALLLCNGDVKPVWLDLLTDAAVQEWLRGPADDPAMGGWLGAYQNWLVARTPQAKRAWFAAIDDVTHRLWTHIMEPLAAALLQRMPVESSATTTVTLIPAGLLALLPLHAAWTEDPSTPTGRRYFLDAFTVNYAPSALALGHARDAAERAPADHLLAVEEPLAASASLLPNVHAEVAAITGLFDSPVILDGTQATRRAVLAALPQAQVVHFSCHGSNNWQSPLESGLLMADDENGKDVLLTVRDLLESRQTGGRLATLSACETGIVGTDLPDEVVALPSALLQAGFGGVAATLWSVADISTAMLMERFYHCWRVDKLRPAQALRAAQQWLRDTTNREKAEYFKRNSPALSAMRMPEGVAIDFFAQVMSRDMDRRDFAHPFWWAAFYLTGV